MRSRTVNVSLFRKTIVKTLNTRMSKKRNSLQAFIRSAMLHITDLVCNFNFF